MSSWPRGDARRRAPIGPLDPLSTAHPQQPPGLRGDDRLPSACRTAWEPPRRRRILRARRLARCARLSNWDSYDRPWQSRQRKRGPPYRMRHRRWHPGHLNHCGSWDTDIVTHEQNGVEHRRRFLVVAGRGVRASRRLSGSEINAMSSSVLAATWRKLIPLPVIGGREIDADRL